MLINIYTQIKALSIRVAVFYLPLLYRQDNALVDINTINTHKKPKKNE
jgi:hypothetical protein